MKQILIFMVALLISRQQTIAQHAFGIKAGINLSNQVKRFTPPQNTESQKQYTEPLLGYQFGAFYKVNLSRKWTISTEGNFSLVGSRSEYTTEEQILNPDGLKHYYNNKIGYLELPVTLQYNLNRLYFGVGPSIAFKVFSRITHFENRSYNSPFYKTLDAAGNLIAGYKISKKWDANFRYSYGLLNVQEHNNYLTTKNRFFNLSVLYSLRQ